MWQRIQTVFLAVAILSLVSSVFLPIWGAQENETTTHQLYALHYSKIENATRATKYIPYCVTAILSIAAATVAAISIRRYDNRLLQMKLGAFNSLLMAGTLASSIYFASGLLKAHGGQFGLGLYVPGVAVVCNLLANQFIRRDEKLVRDSDRLR
jgi:hypothetical protein